MHVKYDSNNSGGKWWLGDSDWKALEDAGWKVEWVADLDENAWFLKKPNNDGRWMGALATSAIKPNCSSLREAIDSFRRATGQSPEALGCSCCGPPHSFSLYDDDDKEIESWSPDYPAYGEPYEG